MFLLAVRARESIRLDLRDDLVDYVLKRATPLPRIRLEPLSKQIGAGIVHLHIPAHALPTLFIYAAAAVLKVNILILAKRHTSEAYTGEFL